MKYVPDAVQVVRCGVDMSRCIPNMTSDAVTLLEADADEIASLKAENERIRQNYISPEVCQMACDERDAAVNDLSLTNTRKFNNPCEICKHNGEKCEPVDLQSVCCKWEWRGLQKGKE